MDLGSNQLESSLYDLPEVLWIKLFANRGKSGDIAEQHGYLPALAFKRRVLSPNFFG